MVPNVKCRCDLAAVDDLELASLLCETYALVVKVELD